MALFWEGIKIGLVLTVMVGPLFFTLVQTGIEEGFKAGAVVGAGIWISDFLFVLLVYGGMSVVAQYVEGQKITLFMGIGGSALLASFGVGQILTARSKHFSEETGSALLSQGRSSSLLSLWLKGFLINTINPFTLFFWLGLMSAVAVRQDLTHKNAVAFFGGILVAIILGDLAKILMAKKIRLLMRPVHFIWLRRISGFALIAFGAALFVRALF